VVYLLLAEGFEEMEALAPVDLLRRVDIEVATVSLTDNLFVMGGHGICVKADITLEQVDFCVLEMLVLPGGLGGVNSIAGIAAAMELIQKVWNAEKTLAAICAAPKLLAELGIINGISVVCHPSINNEVMNAGGRILFNKQATSDKNLITGKAAGSSIEFALELIAALRDRETADKLRSALI
jgi:4-methyl-5(b-hydroxyethyl)-thiazole monophosphate biosynthesis